MSEQYFSRRHMIKGLGALAGLSVLPAGLTARPVNAPKAEHAFTFCLNTSTIMGQKLGLVEEIETAARAGYDGIEIWIRSLERYVREGGRLKDLKKRLDDLGLQVEDAIGFAQWVVDDNDTRMQALEQAKREMDMLAQVGCRRIAAPPAGATNVPGLDLVRAAERFRALLELGVSMGVIPQLEIWGFSRNMSRLSEILFVAAECGHPEVRILPDVYHLYKGGSDVDGLKLISGRTIEIFHLNDYPADPPRESIADKDRIYTGDGVGAVTEVIRTLHHMGGPKVLSLELFNPSYWERDALETARVGLEKMKASVEKALA